MISDKISRLDNEFSDIAEAVRENYMTMNYQLFDKESIEKFNGFVDINNKTVQYNLNTKSLIQPCKPNTIYSVKKINGGSDDRFNIGTFTEIPFAGKIATNVVGDNSANHLEITTGNQDEYLMILYFKTSETKYTEQEIIDSIIIYEGKYDAEKNDTSFRKYKPYQIPKAITDMANDIKDTLYKFLPTRKVIDGVCKNAVNLPIVQFTIDGNVKINRSGDQSSTNPDYPQDIEVIDTVTLFDKDKAISNSSYTGEIGQNIVITTNATTFRATKIVANSNSITIDANKTSGTFRVKLTDSDDIIRYNQAFTTLPQTIDTTTYKNIYIYFDETTITIDNDIQITPGTISKPYLPYGYIGIEQSGKNKLPNNAIIQTITGVTFTLNNDGTIIVNGTATATATYRIYKVINPKDKSNLILSGCPSGGSNTTYDLKIELYTNETWKAAKYDYGNGINLGDLSEYTSSLVSISIRKGYAANNLIFKPMLSEQGGTYEPYHEPIIYPINLNGNILAKVGNIADVLNIYKSGKITLAKNIGKVILDDNINSDYTNIQREYFLFQTLRNDMKKSAKMISNRFTFSSNWGIDTESIFYGGALGNRIQVKILSSRLEANDLESLKKWLSANNVEVYYELIEEENFDLTSIKPIKTWEGTNIFSLITNLETEYSVEYVVDKNSIVNESEVSRRRKEQ